MGAEVDAHLVVITSTQIYHDVLVPVGSKLVQSLFLRKDSERNVPVEEHHRARVIQLVHLPDRSHTPSACNTRVHDTTTHLVEVRHLGDVD